MEPGPFADSACTIAGVSGLVAVNTTVGGPVRLPPSLPQLSPAQHLRLQAVASLTTTHHCPALRPSTPPLAAHLP